jgi:hypothetical protein
MITLILLCRLWESMCNVFATIFFFFVFALSSEEASRIWYFCQKSLKVILRFKMPLVTEMRLHLLHKTQNIVSQNTRMKRDSVPEGCEGPHENLGVPVTFSTLEVVPWLTEGGCKWERTVHRLGKVSTGHVVTAHKGCNIVHRDISSAWEWLSTAIL